MQQFSKIVESGKLEDSFYEKLPEYNREKPTRPELQQYIQDLSASIQGKIVSFSPMTNSEKQLYMQEIIKNASQYEQIKDDSYFYWLELPRDHLPFQRFPFMLVNNSQNQPTLYRQWIQDSSRLFSHAKLYLKALQLGNLESIASFYKNESENDELALKKAETLLNYYTNLQHLSPQAIKNTGISSLRGDALELIQELPQELASNTQTAGKDSKLTRRIQIILNNKGVAKIFDLIPAKLSANSLTLFRDNYQIFSLEQPIDSTTLQRIFGNWTEAFFTLSEGSIEVHYPQFKLKIHGQYRTDNHYFTGVIQEIELLDPTYHLFDGLKVGKSKQELLQSHPFIEESGYIVHFPQYANIQFILDKDQTKIEKIILKSNR